MKTSNGCGSINLTTQLVRNCLSVKSFYVPEFKETILTVPLEFFLNGVELSLNSVNSGNLINH